MLKSGLSTRAARLPPSKARLRSTVTLAWWNPLAALKRTTMTTYASEKWWDQGTTAVVTGANKGIGFETARILAEQGLRTIVAARNEELGRAAAEKLRTGLEGKAGAGNVEFHQLDISDHASVQRFADWAKAELKEIKILINNAGMAYKGNTFGYEEAKATLATNFYGTADVCEELKPLLPEGARVVNVCSSAGKLGIIPKAELRGRLERAGSLAEVSQVAEGFLDAIKRGRHRAEGWPDTMYGMSKALEAAYTRVLAEELRGQGVMVNACCPGWCSTDMSSWRGPRSAAQGADTPVWLALLPRGEFVTGGFFKDRRRESF